MHTSRPFILILFYRSFLGIFFRYENWEDVVFNQRVLSSGVPMWNSIFLAVKPEYQSVGIGSFVYKETVAIMAKQMADRSRFQPRNKTIQGIVSKHRNNSRVATDNICQEKCALVDEKPLIVAFSHSNKNTAFYMNNGFKLVACYPYIPESNKVIPVSLLAIDLFHRGLNDLKKLFLKNKPLM